MRRRYKELSIFLGFIVTLSLVSSSVSSSTPLSVKSETTPYSGVFEDTSSQLLSPPSHVLTNVTELQAFLDELMNEQMETLDIPGAVVAVVKDNTLLFSKGYGFADLARQQPVQADQTLFRIGSVSKLFTWTAIMQLWEQGKVDLDADVNIYLPFEIPPSYPEPITLNHLMTHTAGFEARWFGMAAEAPEDLKTLAGYCASVLPARVRPPGEVQAYSNYGAALAGYIVERISGISFTEYTTKYIYKPLGMDQSTFLQPIPSDLAANMACGYESTSDGFEAVAFWYGNALPAGTMSTTAMDIAKFMIAHLQDGQYGTSHILEPLTAQKMHTRSFSHDPRLNGWAHGWEEKTVNGQRFIQHGGSLPGFVSRLSLSPEHQFGIFLAYNHPNGFIAQIELVQAFMDYYYPASDPSPLVPLPNYKMRADQFTGTYRYTRSSYTTIDKIYDFPKLKVHTDEEGRLRIGGGTVPFIEVEPLLFYPMEEGTIIAGDNYIIFRENPQGKITHLFINNISTGAYERLTWIDNETLHWSVLIFNILVFSAALLFPLLTFVLRKWRKYHQQRVSELSQPEFRGFHGLIARERLIAHAVASITSGLFLLFTLLFVKGSSIGLPIPPDEFLYGRIPLYVYLVFSIPLIGTILTSLLLIVMGLTWKNRCGSGIWRGFYTLVLAACLLFLGQLNYWNLLGFQF